MIGQTNKAILKNKLQRKLRQSMTDAIWNHEVLGQIEAVKERIWLELQKMGAHSSL